MSKYALFAALALLAGAIGAQPQDLTQQLRQILGEAPGVAPMALGDRVRALKTLRRFYGERGYRPAWSGRDGQAGLTDLIGAIEAAAAHGLNPDDYHLAPLRRAATGEDPLGLELLATDAYLTLGAHLVGGRLDPVSIEPDWTAARRERDLAAHLSGALAAGNVAASLDALAPTTPGYLVLKQALAMYREAARDGDWAAIAGGPALKVGEQGARVRALRERLRATGLLAPEAGDSDLFDGPVEAAVAAFQRRIGLEADGVVGPVTLRELNRGAADRVAQIRANLERWRWLPEDLGPRHVRVNIADYRLEARNDGVVERSHDVIVGRSYRMTPVFSGEISYVVLNPWWETPHNLARLDKLPAFRKDPVAVDKLGFEVLDRSGKRLDPASIDWRSYSASDFPFRLRQRPGPQNALGQVKLMFPNKHNVYLHDTPTRDLFTKVERAFSSGCVRVANVISLTEWVLQQTPGWSRDRIDAVLDTGQETRVNLATRVPVHILYFTAVAEPDGSLRLINDVYGRDRRLIDALGSTPP